MSVEYIYVRVCVCVIDCTNAEHVVVYNMSFSCQIQLLNYIYFHSSYTHTFVGNGWI